MRNEAGRAWLSLLLVPAFLWLTGCPDDSKSGTDSDASVEGAAGGGSFDEAGPLPPDSEEQCDMQKPSGFEGDNLCLTPPKAGTGMQLHLGPKSYDANDVAPFLIQPGQEVTECYYMKSPNDEVEFYFPRKIRMRPGSHHLITYITAGDIPDGFGPCNMEDRRGSLGGAERTKVDYPTGNREAPENVGLGKVIAPHAQLRVEWHHINTTDKPILREAWINLYWKPKAEITRYVQDTFMIGMGINVPPGEKHIVHESCEIKQDTRIIEIFGHFHAHTSRFSVWRTRASKSDLVYEVYDWHDTPTVAYDSITKNEAPDRDLLRYGGMTGPLEIKQGDLIEWECEIDNTTDVVLKFGNFLQTAEMCNLFGTYDSNSAALLMCRGTPTITNLTSK